jgi:hypothetical protein
VRLSRRGLFGLVAGFGAAAAAAKLPAGETVKTHSLGFVPRTIRVANGYMRLVSPDGRTMVNLRSGHFRIEA